MWLLVLVVCRRELFRLVDLTNYESTTSVTKARPNHDVSKRTNSAVMNAAQACSCWVCDCSAPLNAAQACSNWLVLLSVIHACGCPASSCGQK